MAKVLTDGAVRKLKAFPVRREIGDGGARGLYLVIQPSGAKSWALRFRAASGRHVKVTLGPLDLSDDPADKPVLGAPLTLTAARALAAEQLRLRATGVDVAGRHIADRRRARRSDEGTTFAALARQFVDDHCRRYTRRWSETARLIGLAYAGDGTATIIKGGLADRWRDRPVTSLTGDDLYGAIDETRRLGAPGLKRARRNGPSDTMGRSMGVALSKMFAWLTEHRKITVNPAIGLYKPPAPAARERVLDMGLGGRPADELRWFWIACDRVGEPFGTALKVLALTGCRRDEVGGMRRAELSADLAVWTIPSGRSKNRREHKVYLPPLARDLVAAMPVIGDGDFIFTATGTAGVSGWPKMKHRLDALMVEAARNEAAAAGRKAAKVSIPPWRIHDIRRTAATAMVELGTAPHVVEAVLNHQSGHKGGVAGIYNRAILPDERKSALKRWATYVHGVVTADTAKVLPLRRHAG